MPSEAGVDSGLPDGAGPDGAIDASKAVCGNGILEAGEDCDGTDLGGLYCSDLGYEGGVLACSRDCTLDTSGCSTLCGNGRKDSGEDCDGSDLGGKECQDFGLGPGLLRCRSDCTFDLSGCPGCGNGVAEDQESCDGSDFRNVACQGTMRCTEDCRLDASGCRVVSAGLGRDGPLVVEGTVNLSDLWAPALPVLKVAQDAVWVDGQPAGFASGDAVVVAALQGCPGGCDHVGEWSFARIQTVDATRIQFQSALDKPFTDDSSGDLGCLKVVLQRVPEFTTVEVRPGGVLTADPWNGRTGGLLVFRASQGVVVDWQGRISMTGAGFSGGPAISGQNGQVGYAGESYCGPGDQGTSPNLGGGGGGYVDMDADDPCGQGGGGAGHNGSGEAPGFTDTCAQSGNGYTAANGGQPYGEPSLPVWLLGSGGGSGATDNDSDTSGPGGAGGGIVVIFSQNLLVAGRIEADGLSGGQGSDVQDSGNGGGGSGGIVWIHTGSVSGSGRITALGGPEEPSTDVWNNPGGAGAPGRIRVDYQTAWAHVFGESAAATYLSVLCEPDPEFSILALF